MRPTSPGGLVHRTAVAVLALSLLPVATLSAKVKIDHDPVESSRSGRRIAIAAEVADRGAAIREARAYFRAESDTRFWFAPMRPQGDDRFLGILPAPALGAGKVHYRIYAVNSAGEFVKTELFTIRIEDDREALRRAEAREPTDVEIDLDRIEQLRDLARRAGEPDPATRVEVRNDVPGSQQPTSLTGFADYVVLADAVPAAAGAGLAGAATVKAGGGVGAGKVVGGALLLGGLAFAATEYSSEDDEGGGSGGVRVTLRNSGVDNIHICVDCTGSQFNDGNRIAAGATRTLEVAIPSGQQSASVRFNAGRNGLVRASATCTVDRGRSLTVRYTETSFNVGSRLLCE